MAKASKNKQFDLEAPTVPVGARFYEIKGTGIYAQKKEALKPFRTNLNEGAGVFEKETKKGDQIIPAVPSNTWPFTITKGPDHPRQ